MKFWNLALGVAAALLVASPGFAQDIGFATVGIISQTMGVNDGRVCTGEFSRGDIGCAANAPYVSRTSGFVGIGTTEPSATLHVRSPNKSAIFIDRDTSWSGIDFGTSRTIEARIAVPANGTGDLTFETSSTGSAFEKMRIGANGNVGIGTKTPAISVTVVGEVQVSNSGVVCNASTAGAIRYTGGALSYCNGSAFTTLSAVGGTVSDRIASGTTSIVAQTGGVISITTNGTTAGYFDTAGRLISPGISITTLNGISSTNGYFSRGAMLGNSLQAANQHPLEIADNISPSLRIRARGQSTEAAIILVGSNTTSNTSQVAMLSAYQPFGGGSADSALDIRVRANGEDYYSPKTVMTLLGSGRVGLATTAPSSTLHVSGTIMAKTAANDNTCSLTEHGAIRFNDVTGRLQICRSKP